ncbi:uncharacterized protein METZ01_LOCUS476142, partial [marine metagenome]
GDSPWVGSIGQWITFTLDYPPAISSLYSVTCNAYDAAGNVGTTTFNVTVALALEGATDTIPPVIVQLSDINKQTTNTAGTSAVFTGVTATDNVGVTSGPNCTPDSGSLFPIGTTTVTCTASDAAGNVGTASFTVTVNYTGLGDAPPVLTVPPNITDSTSNSAGKTVTFTVTASDDVGVTSGPNCTPPSGSNFSVGTTTVTCTASDVAGNTGTGTFTVTISLEDVADTTPPNLVVSNNMPGVPTT